MAESLAAQLAEKERQLAELEAGDEQKDKVDAVSVEPGTLERLETAGRSAWEGATLGLSEPVFGAINAGINTLRAAGADSGTIEQFIQKSLDFEKFRQEYQKDIERRKRLESALPVEAIGGEISGGLLGGLASTAKAVPAAAKALFAAPSAVEVAATQAAKAVPSIAKPIVSGAISGTAAEAIKAGAEVSTGYMKPEEVDLAKAAQFGGVIGGGLGAVVGAVKAAPNIAKKYVVAFGGVDENSINRYLQDPKAFFRAKSREEIKGLIDAQVDLLSQRVESGESSVKEAKEILEAAKNALKNQKIDVAEDLRDAKLRLDSNISKIEKTAKESLNDTQIALRDGVVDSIAELKKKVVAGSARSYDILEKSGRSVSIEPAVAAAQNILSGLKIQGKPPVAGASAAAYNQVKKYIDDLRRYKQPLSATEAKKKIQQIDKDYLAIVEAGEFSDDAQIALKAIRRAFDEQLKDIPEYAAAMADVSEKADLLARSNKLFGTPEKANAKITRIFSPGREQDLGVLEDLGTAAETNIGGLLNQAKQQKSALGPEALIKAGQQTPEYAEVQKLEAAKTLLRRPIAAAQIGAIMPGQSAVALAQQSLAKKQQEVLKIKDTIKSLGPFASPATNIGAIGQAVGKRNPEFDNYLKSLSELSDKDFVQLVDDLSVAEAFAKEFRGGSRNVNIWAFTAGGAAYAMTKDLPTALVIAGLGSQLGGSIDRFGPKITRKILDGYLKIDGLPTQKKLSAAFADLPKEVVARLKQDVIRSLAVTKDEEVAVDPSNVASMQRDITESDLSPLKKAQMLYAVQNGEPLRSKDVAAIVAGKDLAAYMERAKESAGPSMLFSRKNQLDEKQKNIESAFKATKRPEAEAEKPGK
jgi:hypothetical protein